MRPAPDVASFKTAMSSDEPSTASLNIMAVMQTNKTPAFSGPRRRTRKRFASSCAPPAAILGAATHRNSARVPVTAAPREFEPDSSNRLETPLFATEPSFDLSEASSKDMTRVGCYYPTERGNCQPCCDPPLDGQLVIRNQPFTSYFILSYPRYLFVFSPGTLH